jgi:DNA-binding MarR family transcriptional regulator
MNTEKMKAFKGALGYLSKNFEGCGKEGSSCCGVTRSQWDVLVEVGDQGAMSLIDLAKALSLDTSTLSRTVNGMVMVGLLERIQSTTDRRFVTIELSERGQVLLKQINQIYENQMSAMLTYLPLERQALALEVLLELAEAAQKANADSNHNCCL